MKQAQEKSPGARAAATALIGAVAIVLGLGVAQAGAQSAPSQPTTSHHKAKGKSTGKALTVKPLAAGAPVPGAAGPVSPYARAAAQHAQSGEPPPGHPVVHHPAPLPTN
jgi:hypothetical protein